MGVYRQRPLLTALVAIFLITTLTYYMGYSIQPADTFEPTERPKVPVRTSDLAVTLHQVRRDQITIQVIVENKHPYSFITLLLWDSPLDVLALPIGLFEVKPEGSEKIMPFNKTEIKRRYPPKRDVLLAIGPGDRRAQDVVLAPPVFPLQSLRERGDNATIKMKGRWKAVWEGAEDDVTDESLRSIEVNRGGMMGRFETDELEIDLWNTEDGEPDAGQLQEEPPPEGNHPPEEDALEGEFPPEDGRPEGKSPVDERPPADDDGDHEELGKVLGEPKPNGTEKDNKEDEKGSKDTSKDDAKDKQKDDDGDSKEEDSKGESKKGGDHKDEGKKTSKHEGDDEKSSKDSKKGGKGKDDEQG